MSDVTRRSFNVILLIFRQVGLYREGNKSLLLKIQNWLTCLFLAYLSSGLVINLYIMKHLSSMELNDLVFSAIVITTLSLKIIPFLFQGTRIKKCMDYFGQGRFIPRYDREKRIFEDCIRICSRNTKLYLGALFLALSFWMFLKMVTHRLPVTIWLPYDAYTEPIIYYPSFIYIGLGSAYCVFIGRGIEPILGGLMYQATCQMRILKFYFENIDKIARGNMTDEYNYSEYSKHVSETLRLCIVRHADILNFIKEFQSCFNLCISTHMAGDTFALCYTYIGLILTNPASSEGILYIVIYMIISFQMLFYCYFGTLLYEENEGLINSMYMGFWYNFDVKNRKLLIFIMERAKKSQILTAGKIMDLTLATFTSILKGSYSMVAVMKTV